MRHGLADLFFLDKGPGRATQQQEGDKTADPTGPTLVDDLRQPDPELPIAPCWWEVDPFRHGRGAHLAPPPRGAWRRRDGALLGGGHDAVVGDHAGCLPPVG